MLSSSSHLHTARSQLLAHQHQHKRRWRRVYHFPPFHLEHVHQVDQVGRVQEGGHITENLHIPQGAPHLNDEHQGEENQSGYSR